MSARAEEVSWRARQELRTFGNWASSSPNLTVRPRERRIRYLFCRTSTTLFCHRCPGEIWSCWSKLGSSEDAVKEQKGKRRSIESGMIGYGAFRLEAASSRRKQVHLKPTARKLHSLCYQTNKGQTQR